MPQATLDNPFRIEKARATTGNPDDPSNIPLFLIHDGGGTIVSYTMLGSLRRTVWGIHNPKFYEGGFWDGGFLAMAEHYTELIRSNSPRGSKILLGGESRQTFQFLCPKSKKHELMTRTHFQAGPSAASSLNRSPTTSPYPVPHPTSTVTSQAS